MKACYPCARTMSWLRDFMSLTSSLPNLFGTKSFVVVYIMHIVVFRSKCKVVIALISKAVILSIKISIEIIILTTIAQADHI
jgi:hypothetical protein